MPFKDPQPTAAAEAEQAAEKIRHDPEIRAMALELQGKYQVMIEKIKNKRKKDGKEFPPDGIVAYDNLSDQDQEIIDNLGELFEKTCGTIPSIEIGEGGNRTKDELKRLFEDLYLCRIVEVNYDVDESRYYMLSPEEARLLLQDSITQRNKQIQDLESKNQQATKELDLIGTENKKMDQKSDKTQEKIPNKSFKKHEIINNINMFVLWSTEDNSYIFKIPQIESPIILPPDQRIAEEVFEYAKIQAGLVEYPGIDRDKVFKKVKEFVQRF